MRDDAPARVHVRRDRGEDGLAQGEGEGGGEAEAEAEAEAEGDGEGEGEGWAGRTPWWKAAPASRPRRSASSSDAPRVPRPGSSPAGRIAPQPDCKRCSRARAVRALNQH